MTFDKCIHPRNQNLNKDREHFYHPRNSLMPSSPLSIGNHSSGFYLWVILPFLELHIKGIMQYILFYFWLLSFKIFWDSSILLHWSFIHSFFLLPNSIPLYECTTIYLFIPSPIGESIGIKRTDSIYWKLSGIVIKTLHGLFQLISQTTLSSLVPVNQFIASQLQIHPSVPALQW